MPNPGKTTEQLCRFRKGSRRFCRHSHTHHGSGHIVNVTLQATGTDGLPHQTFLRELRQFNVLENICHLSPYGCRIKFLPRKLFKICLDVGFIVLYHAIKLRQHRHVQLPRSCFGRRVLFIATISSHHLLVSRQSSSFFSSMHG